MEDKKKTTWEVLSATDCSKYTDKKNNLTYLSWAWAWGLVKEKYPDVNYKVRQYDGKPYLFDENLGYLVTTEVTINGETIEMSLPVMDSANKAQKHIPYSYTVKEYKNGKYTGNFIEKNVEPATMFDINTAIMRCLTKNLAMFGLGHYIYAGEDIPQQIENTVEIQKTLIIASSEANEATTVDSLQNVWNKYEELHNNAVFIKLITDKKRKLTTTKNTTHYEEKQ